MSQYVQNGPLGGRTKAQLDVIRVEFTSRTPAYGQALTGASINGQSYQFGTATYTEAEFWDILKDAYCQVGCTQYGYPGGRTARGALGR